MGCTSPPAECGAEDRAGERAEARLPRAFEFLVNTRGSEDVGARMAHRLVLLPLALTVLLAGPGLASASHYRFDRVELVTQGEQRALAHAGITDTRSLLGWTASRKRRVWLTRTTGLSYERLTALATQCDLLRIDGVGPSMVEALQKAAVQTTGDLARSQPPELLERLRKATAGTPLRYRLPTEDTLEMWIDNARHLRPLLEDIPAPTP